MVRIGTVSALLLAAFGASHALAADKAYTESRAVVDETLVPACDNPRVQSKVANAFHDKESEYWDSDLKLVGFSQTVEIGYRPWGPEFIPRRFCSARTLVSDQVERTVFYSIGNNTGTLGITWGVEFCVTGLDRNLAYSPNCKMAGP